MKKIFLGFIGILLAFSLAACGNSANNAAINSLGVQLDETTNTISSVEEVNPYDMNFSSNNSVANSATNAQQSLFGEQNYRHEIMSRTARIKKGLNKKVNLSKAQANAVKDLTSNLAKYTNSVAYTKNELSSTVKSLKKLKKNPDKHPEKLNAKLNRLACNSNTRASYYENILNTLNQLEEYFPCENCDQPQTLQEPTDNQAEKIDETAENTSETAENEYPIQHPTAFERVTYPMPPMQRYPMPYNNFYGYGYANGNFAHMNGTYQNGNFAGYPIQNGTYMNGYFGGYNGNMPYNYNFRFYRFNPYRNTDTYAPNLSNVDTYRLPTNENAALVDNPEERLENFEELTDENTEINRVENAENQNFDNQANGEEYETQESGENQSMSGKTSKLENQEKTLENNLDQNEQPNNKNNPDQSTIKQFDDLDSEIFVDDNDDEQTATPEENIDEDFSLNILILNSDKSFEDWKKEFKCPDGNCAISTFARKPEHKKIIAH